MSRRRSRGRLAAAFCPRSGDGAETPFAAAPRADQKRRRRQRDKANAQRHTEQTRTHRHNAGQPQPQPPPLERSAARALLKRTADAQRALSRTPTHHLRAPPLARSARARVPTRGAPRGRAASSAGSRRPSWTTTRPLEGQVSPVQRLQARFTRLVGPRALTPPRLLPSSTRHHTQPSAAAMSRPKSTWER